jgi:hypothetical protein
MRIAFVPERIFWAVENLVIGFAFDCGVPSSTETHSRRPPSTASFPCIEFHQLLSPKLADNSAPLCRRHDGTEGRDHRNIHSRASSIDRLMATHHSAQAEPRGPHSGPVSSMQASGTAPVNSVTDWTIAAC